MPPLLSIICCTLNCKEDLKITIQSFLSQNNIEHDQVELIVIDGVSTDGTLEVCKENFHIINRLVSERDNGIYGAMNKGIKLATGRYLQFLNAGDCYFDNNSLQKVISHLNKENPDSIATGCQIVNSNYEKVFDTFPKLLSEKNLIQFGTGTINHQSFFIRKEIAPFYSEKYRLKGELNWYFDIATSGKNIQMFLMPDLIIKYKLGGLGQKLYYLNLFEWIKILYKRYGLILVLKNYYVFKKYLKYISKVKKHS